MITDRPAKDNQRGAFVDRVGWFLFALVIIVVVGAMTFRRVDIALDPDDGSITAVESRWWGAQKIMHPLHFVVSSDGLGGWMTTNERGETYRYVESDNSSE